MRVAALTMMYNEPVWAGVWVRHYARQVGAAHCVILDHGTDDGSLDGVAALGVRVERMRRSALDEDARAAVMSEVAATLLQRFDAVVHSDADELLVADPARFASLAAYAEGAPEVATAIGLDLQHLPDAEPPLDPAAALGAQRRWVRFSGAMCKPALIRRPVRWDPGFHGCDRPRALAPLYLVHLRYADLGAGLDRLRRTRAQAFATAETNPHQRVADREFETMMRSIAALPREEGELAMDGPALAPWVATMQEGWRLGESRLSVAGDRLWALPEAVRGVL